MNLIKKFGIIWGIALCGVLHINDDGFIVPCDTVSVCESRRKKSPRKNNSSNSRNERVRKNTSANQNAPRICPDGFRY